jgi:predicted dienelactone hydrolase
MKALTPGKLSVNTLWLRFLAVLALLGAAPAFAGKLAELVHVKRQDGREIALSVYRPDESSACPALALLSHGAGGDEKGLAYLAEALQADGWTAIVIGHPESAPDALRASVKHAGGLHNGLLELTTNPVAYQDRFMDIDAAEQWHTHECKPPFVALLGHSMGAATVMLEAGAKNKLGLQTRTSINAFVALSPQGPGSVFPPQAWQDIHKPVLMLTGTKDKALEGEWTTRTLPFDDMSPGCKWLGVVDGATHMNFAGSGFSHKTEKVVTGLVTTFLDSLRDSGHCAVPPDHSGAELKTK